VSDRRSGSAETFPEALLWLSQRVDGRLWLDRLPDLIEAASARFVLDWHGVPFAGGNVSYVAPVSQNGREAVLKLQFPSRECRFEAEALKQWAGNGAARLLDHAPELNALLLERCRPGQCLADDPDVDHMDVLTGLLRQLLIPADLPFSSLNDEAALWLRDLEPGWLQFGKPCEKRLVDAAAAALSDLPGDSTDQVLLHQDLHGQNILSGERALWLAIDPKPLVGDPAFALSPVVRSFEFGHSKIEALYRLDRLSDELGLDRERARLWTIAQTMAWAFGSPHIERHFDTVQWLLGDTVR